MILIAVHVEFHDKKDGVPPRALRRPPIDQKNQKHPTNVRRKAIETIPDTVLDSVPDMFRTFLFSGQRSEPTQLNRGSINRPLLKVVIAQPPAGPRHDLCAFD